MMCVTLCHPWSYSFLDRITVKRVRMLCLGRWGVVSRCLLQKGAACGSKHCATVPFPVVKMLFFHALRVCLLSLVN